jgi:hypothetical protein
MKYMARKLKKEYEKWGLAINLEKTKYMYGRKKRNFKIQRRRRNEAVYRMYLFRYKNRPVMR